MPMTYNTPPAMRRPNAAIGLPGFRVRDPGDGGGVTLICQQHCSPDAPWPGWRVCAALPFLTWLRRA